MKKTLLAFVVVFLLFRLTEASSTESVSLLFEKGNKAYLDENYEEAVRQYERILRGGYESGILYFNLGNAYFKTDQIGKSILNYERARIWLPRDGDLLFNLKLANLKVKDRIESPPEFFLFRWIRVLVNLYSLKGWAVWMTVSAALAALCFAIAWLFELKRTRFPLRFLLIISFVIFITTIPLMVGRHGIETKHDQGVILNYSVKSLSAPQKGSTELFIVHEGTKVKILDQEDNWYKIELIDGKQGWISSDGLGII